MAKPKLVGRRNTSVNLTEDQIAWIKAEGYEISALLRDLIDKFMEQSMSSEELLLKKKQELLDQQKVLLEEISIIDTQLGKREEKKHIAEKIQSDEEELEERRKTYVLGCSKNMRTEKIARGLWINHLREAFKFSSGKEAREYVLKTWVEDGADEARVRKYLQLS